MRNNFTTNACKVASNTLATGILLAGALACSPTDAPDYLAMVDPMIGTGAHFSADAADLWGSEGLARKPKPLPTSKRGTMAGYDNAHDPGQCIPAVLEPFGMNFWVAQTEDTEQKGIAPYYYADEEIQGFRGSHWIVGSMTQDYGSFTLMPLGATLVTDPLKRGSRFSHADEVATPAYYSVELQDYGIRAEMTGSSRAGLFRFTYREAGDVFLVVNPNSDEGCGSILFDAESGQILGSNPVHRIYQGKGEYAGFDGHFVVQVDKDLLDGGVYAGDEPLAGACYVDSVPRVGAWVRYHVEAGETVVVRAASSFTGIAGALGNMQAEASDYDFDAMRQRLAQKWQQHLGRIEATAADASLLTSFYTALYHASFLPHDISDADGSYPSFAGGSLIHRPAPEGGESQLPVGYYDDFSLWDTYRAQHPLICLLQPERAGAMIQSMVSKHADGGWLPIFPCWNSYTSEMIGDHCCSLVADAWFKGVRNFDFDGIYEALCQNARCLPADYSDYVEGKGRRALDSYLKYGYIPVEDPVSEAYHQAEQSSRTLEYAYDDYCLARLAYARGDSAWGDTLMLRAQNYRNVFNPQLGWVDGRHADGSWVGGDPFAFQKYICEGKPCHYTWYVPHDVEGLIALMGGAEAFCAKLDTLFEGRHYWHGNEPCHQIAYLYDYAGHPEKTRQRVSRILEEEYAASADGLAGNDDAGQMSAWYIFSSMGFYPVCPGWPEYALGPTSFDQVVLHLDGSDFTLRRGDGSMPRLNGVPLERPFLSHEQLLQGGILDL